MHQTNKKAEDNPEKHDIGISLLEQVTPLARKINCLDIDRVAEVCVTSIPKLVGARFASLYILDETNNILHLHKHNHPFLINKIVSLNKTPTPLMVMAVKSKELILVPDIDTHNKPVIKKSQRAFADNYQTKNCAVVPLICQERVVGVLNLADKMGDKGFESEDIVLIELFGQLIGASIGNIKLFERTQRQAITDGLTGLVNHKTFYEILEKELWRSRRYGGQISLIMVDIDNLKQVNDVYGHSAGDQILRLVAQVLEGETRFNDFVSRYGGEEFVVLLPESKADQGRYVAEKIRRAVENASFMHADEKIKVTVSAGVGEVVAESETPETFVDRVDAALYQAKKNGRNRVEMAAD